MKCKFLFSVTSFKSLPIQMVLSGRFISLWQFVFIRLKSYVSILFQSWFNPVKHFVSLLRKALYWYHLLILILCTGLPEDLKNPNITVLFLFVACLFLFTVVFLLCDQRYFVIPVIEDTNQQRELFTDSPVCICICYLLYISLLMYTTNYWNVHIYFTK